MVRPKIDIIAELGRFLPGEALERIKDEVEDPGSTVTCGEMARLGGAFSALGTTMTDSAKDALTGVQRHLDDEVLFKWTDPSEFWALDSVAVKKMFPQEDYPDLYKRQQRKGFVSIELPFEVK